MFCLKKEIMIMDDTTAKQIMEGQPEQPEIGHSSLSNLDEKGRYNIICTLLPARVSRFLF